MSPPISSFNSGKHRSNKNGSKRRKKEEEEEASNPERRQRRKRTRVSYADVPDSIEAITDAIVYTSGDEEDDSSTNYKSYKNKNKASAGAPNNRAPRRGSIISNIGRQRYRNSHYIDPKTSKPDAGLISKQRHHLVKKRSVSEKTNIEKNPRRSVTAATSHYYHQMMETQRKEEEEERRLQAGRKLKLLEEMSESDAMEELLEHEISRQLNMAWLAQRKLAQLCSYYVRDGIVVDTDAVVSKKESEIENDKQEER